MAITVEELVPNKIYSSKTKLLLPINDNDKKHGSSICLLAPTQESSLKLIQLPYLINRRYFESYYVEKDISLIINHESGQLLTESYDTINESKITISNPKELLDLFNSFGYGVYKDGKIQDLDGIEFFKAYRSSNPKDFIKKKGGVCWDYTAAEALYFKDFNIPYRTFYIELDNENSSTHTFLIYENNNKFYYFESSYGKHQGIYESNSINRIINFVLYNMFTDEERTNFKVYEYNALDPKLNNGLTTIEFMDYIITNGKKINLTYNPVYKLNRI